MLYSVPLVLKVIKWSWKLHIKPLELLEFMTNNMKRFQNVFEKHKISKGAFYGLLFASSPSQVISPEAEERLKNYVFETV